MKKKARGWGEGGGRKGKRVKERTEKLGRQGVLSDTVTGREIVQSSAAACPARRAGWRREV